MVIFGCKMALEMFKKEEKSEIRNISFMEKFRVLPGFYNIEFLIHFRHLRKHGLVKAISISAISNESTSESERP